MLDSNFLKIVEELNYPLSGTETMAPTLYYLIRSSRAQNVLEYGSGYSTLFILKALQDNLSDYYSEINALKSKPSNFAMPISQDNFYSWLDDKDIYNDPEFYLNSYTPKLVVFERQPKNHTYVKKLLDVVDKLGLSSFLFLIEGNACEYNESIPKQFIPFDLIWNDDCDYEQFFDIYWDLLRNNGYLMFHNTVNSYSENEFAITYIKTKLQNLNHQLIDIVEPHKLNQNSFTLIKKVSPLKTRHINNIKSQEEIYSNFLNLLLKEKNNIL